MTIDPKLVGTAVEAHMRAINNKIADASSLAINPSTIHIPDKFYSRKAADLWSNDLLRSFADSIMGPVPRFVGPDWPSYQGVSKNLARYNMRAEFKPIFAGVDSHVLDAIAYGAGGFLCEPKA